MSSCGRTRPPLSPTGAKLSVSPSTTRAAAGAALGRPPSITLHASRFVSGGARGTVLIWCVHKFCKQY